MASEYSDENFKSAIKLCFLFRESDNDVELFFIGIFQFEYVYKTLTIVKYCLTDYFFSTETKKQVEAEN